MATAHTYQRDGEERVSAVDSGSTWGFTYNAVGDRAQWAHTGGAEQHLFDAAGNWLGVAGAYSLVPFGNHYLLVYTSSDTMFNHVNHLSSTTLRTSHSGTPLEDMLFYPWGEVWKSWGSGGYTFAALPYNDVSTTTNLTGSRVSSPNLGRWLTPDPAGEDAADPSDPQTWNMYAYVRNTPTTLTDPMGLDPPGSPPQSPNVSCTMDRASVPCSELNAALHYGLADLCPNNDCSGLRAVQGPGDSTFFEKWVPSTFTTSEQNGQLTMNLTTGHWSTVGVADDSSSWWGTFATSFLSLESIKTAYTSAVSRNGCGNVLFSTFAGDFVPFGPGPAANDVVEQAPKLAYLAGIAKAGTYAISHGLPYPLRSATFRALMGRAYVMADVAEAYVLPAQIAYATLDAVASASSLAYNGGCR